MKAKKWLIIWFVSVLMVFIAIGACVYKVDPFFHYHKPDVSKYFYVIDNERSQNDGIEKHFDYNAVITGSSMTQNFKTSEMDEIFGCNSIKVPFAGASFKELDDNIATALRANPEVKIVVRGLDMGRLSDSADIMRMDLGDYPTYLYDSNPFNDVNYLLNKDVVLERVYPMIRESRAGEAPGITSFDEYSRWQENYSYGIDSVKEASPEAFSSEKKGENSHLSQEEKDTIRENITLNLTDLADEYPEVQFYYFYTPYSIASWKKLNSSGTLQKRFEIIEYVTELIVPHENIRLYYYDYRHDITTDLNNYRDHIHYASWVNSIILRLMHDDEGRLTESNYKSVLQQELDYYSSYDYDSLDDQEDYEADNYAGALLNHELTGAEPMDILSSGETDLHPVGTEYSTEDGITAIKCRGKLDRDPGDDGLGTYLRDTGYVGIRFNLNLSDGHNYLSYYGQKAAGAGDGIVCVYDMEGNMLYKIRAVSGENDFDKHHYVIDLSSIDGEVTVIMSGGSLDRNGGEDSEYQYSEIMLY